MGSKLPHGAFEFYAALGNKRSYSAVAKNFGVDKTTVVRRAREESWQSRIAEAAAMSWEERERNLADRMAEANSRALAMCEELREKCLKVIRKANLTPSEALRGLAFATDMERVVLGMPTDRVVRDSRVAVARVNSDMVPQLVTPPRTGVPDTTLDGSIDGYDPMTTFRKNALPKIEDEDDSDQCS